MRRLPHGRRRRIEAREPPRRQQTPRPLKLHLERVPLRHEAIALEQGGIPLNGELTPLCRSAVSGSCERLPGLRMRLDLRLKRNHLWTDALQCGRCNVCRERTSQRYGLGVEPEMRGRRPRILKAA